MSYTFQQEHAAQADEVEVAQVDETDGKTGVDPIAMSGTLDTSGTSGVTETAEEVSAVFEVADEAAAKIEDTEESLGRSPEDELAEAAKSDDEPEPSVGDENKFDGRKDPGDYTVKEVQAYLATATDKQKASVRAKEAKGQNRVGIMND